MVAMRVTVNPSAWAGKKVFLTGHTGFKGGWLATWLNLLGCKVHGFSLPPATTPNLFTAANVRHACASHVPGDLRDAQALVAAIEMAQPEVIFHMAAQPLVRASYAAPLETFATNVLGTAHVLEACHQIGSVRAVIVVSSDKCYENREWHWGYRESDPLGGHDPYSASKACAELVSACYRRSFLNAKGIGIATARAGNVIGGGDWADERLLPDMVRAFSANQPARLRHPEAVRPWQHVLEPLHGYLLLAERLAEGDASFARAWNFGPLPQESRTVGEVATLAASQWGVGARIQIEPDNGPHESGLLILDSSEARARIQWQSRWDLETALRATLDWYHAYYQGRDVTALTRQQIEHYMQTEP